MAIVSDLSNPKTPDATLVGYDEAPVSGMPGYASVLVNGVEAARITSGTTYTAFQAHGTATNIPVVLMAKGTGAVQAQIADSTSVGGNTRGANAVDWQTVRSLATQVASGSRAAIAGGVNNIASGTTSTVGGGDTNNASALGAAIGGGRGNTANGQDSWVAGGGFASTRATIGRGAFASGQFAATGDAQAGEFVLRKQSTDAIGAVLTSDNLAPSSTNIANLPTNGSYMVQIFVVARQTGATGDSAGWNIFALCRREGTGAVTLVGGGGASIAPTYSDAGASTWRVTVAGAGTSGGIVVTGAGEAAKNITWVARIMSVEVGIA